MQERDNVKQMRRAWTAGLFAGAMLAGCAVGPDFQEPAAPVTRRYTETPLPPQTVASPGTTGGEAQRLAPGRDLPADWWTLFRSEPLDGLIRAALIDSPDLAAAQATLRQAQELYAAGTGRLLFPQVDGSVGATREKISGAELGNPGLGTSIFNLYNASVNVSYTLDVFGRNQRELEGLRSQVDYQSFQLEAAYIALTSNIVTTAVREASLRGQIRATQDIIAAEQKVLDLTKRQRELGAVAGLAVLAQGTQVAQFSATLPPLERELARTRHELAVLAGRFPSTAALPTFELEALTLPQDVPVSLPSSLVRQRPDIRAAEALWHKASADVGVATANLYPQITISGAFGAQTTQFANLFAGPSVWSIGAALLQPLFHGGALTAERRAAIAAYDAAAAQYRETVLKAFQQVADALRALDDDARALQAQAEAERLAAATLKLTQRQLQLGAVNYLALLIAQRQYELARIALVQAQAARYADTAALFLALGGGWWNRPDAADAGAPAGEAVGVLRRE